jgi:hypothetical protein
MFPNLSQHGPLTRNHWTHNERGAKHNDTKHRTQTANKRAANAFGRSNRTNNTRAQRATGR